MKKKKEKNEEEIPIVFQRMHNFFIEKKENSTQHSYKSVKPRIATTSLQELKSVKDDGDCPSSRFSLFSRRRRRRRIKNWNWSQDGIKKGKIFDRNFRSYGSPREGVRLAEHKTKRKTWNRSVG